MGVEKSRHSDLDALRHLEIGNMKEDTIQPADEIARLKSELVASRERLHAAIEVEQATRVREQAANAKVRELTYELEALKRSIGHSMQIPYDLGGQTLESLFGGNSPKG